MNVNGNINLDENEIIERIKFDNSALCFNVLYKKYYHKVLNKCYSFVRNRKIAKELTEDIFSKTYEKLSGFKQLSSFSSWLYVITYNHCIDFLREKKKLNFPGLNLENIIPEIIDENDETNEDINYEDLMDILEMIHPEDRSILLMKYLEELSLKDIGALLLISDDAVKMRLKRARSRVLALYKQKYLKSR